MVTRHQTPEGKRLLDEFSRPPFGWSNGTTRYLVAALFYAQRVMIRTNGSDFSAIGDHPKAKSMNLHSAFTVSTLRNALN